MSIIGSLFKTGLWLSSASTAILILSVIVAPPPIGIEPRGFSVSGSPKFEGSLSKNDELSNASKLFEQKIHGPESFALFQGDIYTGTADGLILKFKPNGKSLQLVAHIGDDRGCKYEGRWSLSKCGRPLGLRFDSKGDLYVLDAYYGIKKVNIKNGKVEMAFELKNKILASDDTNRTDIFIDDFVIVEKSGKKGGHVFYVTDASSKWPLEFVNHVVLENDQSGRILKCDTDTQTVEIVDSNLAFPNGIELTGNGEAILVNELNKRQILKYFIKGSKSGKKEILISNLPGFPDNIKKAFIIPSQSSDTKDKVTAEETYWVALYEGFDENNGNALYEVAGSFSQVLKLAYNLSYNLGSFLHQIGGRINVPWLKLLGYEIKSLTLFQKIYKSYGLVIEINSKGQIIRSLHSPSGAINHLSEVHPVKDAVTGRTTLYLGSYFNPYIAKYVLH